jgi:outer membrane protein TolC
VEDASPACSSPRKRLSSRRSGRTPHAASGDLAFVQYKEGAVDFQRVLDAQRSLLEEQNTLAQTRSAVATNLIALYKALGGGWEMTQGQPYIQERFKDEMKDRTDWGDYFEESPEPRTDNASEHDRR